MELIKKNIHIDRMKCKAATQITLEDDINITDSRPDVYQLIEEQGEIVIDELRAVADALELATGKDYWPFPTYADLLFGVN